jgi:hypothetical protein
MVTGTCTVLSSQIERRAYFGSIPAPAEDDIVRRTLLLFLSMVCIGCESSTTTGSSSKPQIQDPNIRVKEAHGGMLGPVGAGRQREYEGPASKAPDWAKPKNK